MKLFKLVSVSIRGGILSRKPAAQIALPKARPLPDITSDYEQLKKEFNEFITAHPELKKVEPTLFDLGRKATFAGFGPDGTIRTFNPDEKKSLGSKRYRGGFMSFSDLQERDKGKWAAEDLQGILERTQDQLLRELLAPFEGRIKGLLIELGLRDAEGAGKAHDRTVIQGVDLSAKDMVTRLNEDLTRIGVAVLQQ